MSEDGWDDGEDWDGNDEEEWDDVTPMASGATAVPQPDLGLPIATPSALPVPENVTITLGSVAAGDSNQVTSQKRSRRVLFRSKEEIDMLRRLHKVHLLACFSRLKWLSRPLEDTLLEGLLLSEMPATFSWNVLPSRLTVSNLATWFHDRFCIDVDGLEGVDYLRDVVTNAASIRPCPVTASQGCQLFVAACRVLGYRCRIVSAIQSIPVSRTIPLTHPSPAKGAGIVMARCLTSAQPAPKPTPKSKSLKRSRTDGDDTKPAPDVPVLVPHSVLKGSLLPPHFTAVERLWVEVCTLSSPLSEGCDGEDEDSLSWSTLVDAIQWLPVDMTRGCVSSEDDFSSLASKSCYVVACEGGSRFTDVTARYCEKFSVIEAARASNSTTAWVPNTLKQLNVRFSEGSDGIHDVIDLTDEPPSWQSVLACICDCIDLQSLALASRNGDIPTSLSGFKSHPRYCLQIQLGRNEALFPLAEPVGDFKGQPVYLRKHVQPVYRKDAWRRLGREVLPDQLGSPVKTTSRKLTMKKSRLTSAETPNTHVDIALFGEWQTRARVPPTIIDGIIPKNEHGNIEVWHPCDIPIGSVHLRGNRIGMIASSLGVDYAPVVVGFQRNEAGFTVPVMDGIIIPQAMENVVWEAYEAAEQASLERTLATRAARVAKRWRTLVRGLFLKKRLEDTYLPNRSHVLQSQLMEAAAMIAATQPKQ